MYNSSFVKLSRVHITPLSSLLSPSLSLLSPFSLISLFSPLLSLFSLFSLISLFSPLLPLFSPLLSHVSLLSPSLSLLLPTQNSYGRRSAKRGVTGVVNRTSSTELLSAAMLSGITLALTWQNLSSANILMPGRDLLKRYIVIIIYTKPLLP